MLDFRGIAIPSKIRLKCNKSVTESTPIRILVSGDYDQLLECQGKRLRKTCTIRSSDWINDFQEPMGIGRFFIVEVPTPELNAIDVTALSGEHKNFIDRLNKAYETIEEMEQDLRNGEWGNVVMKLRNIELFKVNFTNFIKKMISETTSIEEVKAGELTLAIEKLRVRK